MHYDSVLYNLGKPHVQAKEYTKYNLTNSDPNWNK